MSQQFAVFFPKTAGVCPSTMQMKDIQKPTPPGGGGKPGNGGSCKPGSPSPGRNVLTANMKQTPQSGTIFRCKTCSACSRGCCTRKAAKSTELAGCFGAFCTLKTATKKWVDLRSSQQTWPSQFKICKINLSWRSPGRLPHPRFGLLGSLKLLNVPPTIQVPLLPAQMLPAMGPSWWSTWISIFHIFQLQSDLKDNKCWTMDTWKNLKEGSQHLRRPANLGTLMNSYTWKQSNLLNSDNPGFGAARSNTNLGSPSYIACPWPGRRCLWKWLAANPRNEAANRARPKRQNAGKAVGLDQNPKLSLVPSPLRTSERLNHANICKLCYSSGLKECKQWGRVSQRMYAEATTLHCWNCERSLPAKSLQ